MTKATMRNETRTATNFSKVLGFFDGKGTGTDIDMYCDFNGMPVMVDFKEGGLPSDSQMQAYYSLVSMGVIVILVKTIGHENDLNFTRMVVMNPEEDKPLVYGDGEENIYSTLFVAQMTALKNKGNKGRVTHISHVWNKKRWELKQKAINNAKKVLTHQ